MKTLSKELFAAGLVGIVAFTAPASLAAQRSGPEIWSQTCGRCHLIQPANRYTASQWESIMMNMEILARMTDDEADAVLAFLKGGAKRVASAEPVAEPTVLARLASLDGGFLPLRLPSGEELYKQQCAACHGKTGKGDGPAAVALNPRPSDLTDPESMSKLSDEQLLEVISMGRGTMPGFAALLKPEELEAIAAYVRSMSTGLAKP